MLYFERGSKDEFDGFVNYFTKNRVKISKYFTAEGSNFSGWGNPSTTLDYSITSTKSSDQWVSASGDPKIVFTTKCPIYLTHYRLRTRTDNTADTFPVSWKVEGQSNNGTWSLIDTKTDRTELCAIGANATFECDTPMSINKIKISVSKTSLHQHFHLSRIEFFGIMNITQCSFPFRILNIYGNTCNRKRIHNNLYLSFYILLVTYS